MSEPLDTAEVAQILADVDWLTDNWADLVEHRQPGTARPWRQALLDPDRRAEMARRDREERANRDPDAPGFTVAPTHVDVLDTIVAAWVALDELVALISPDWRRTASGNAVNRPASEYGPAPVTEIDGMVEFIRTWLPATTSDLDSVKLGRVGRALTRCVTDATRLLGLIRAGQLLNGALCPWCKGVTPKHPEGGAVTMRVEEIPGSSTLGTQPAAAVVCWNPLCEPPEVDCGTWYRGRPSWPWHEWEWLAKRLIIADPPATILPPATFWDDPEVIAIHHSGRSGVDQALCIVPPRLRAVPTGTLEQPGEWAYFVGGPFEGQRRRFIRLDDTLAVTRGPRRYRLTYAYAPEAVGTYRFEIVNDRPSYVWSAA